MQDSASKLLHCQLELSGRKTEVTSSGVNDCGGQVQMHQVWFWTNQTVVYRDNRWDEAETNRGLFETVSVDVF